ncbi:MAG TPA: hypothetical protein VGF99_11405, partial [Myxococcota bacterium]
LVAQAEAEAASAAQASAQAAQQAALDTARAASPGAFWSTQARGLSDVDRAALAVLDRPVVDKIKDATRGQPFKVNAYADDHKRFNRLKVDLDRDNVDDETWTIFADGRIEKKVSSKDDGAYDQGFRLDLSGWQDMSKAAPAPAPSAADRYMEPNGSTSWPRVSASDAAMEAVLRLPVLEKIKDATKAQPFKINLYSDDGKRFNRAKVDLDRDDRWDESWTFKSATAIEKKVAPADDENYSEVYVAKDGGWVKQ